MNNNKKSTDRSFDFLSVSNERTVKNSILNVDVSCFQSVEHPANPKKINLLDWCQSLKYMPDVQGVREAKSIDERKRLKKLLPAITPSGTFNYRSSKNLINHSGFISIDIDYDENKHILNYAELKSQLSNIQEVAFVGISVSGLGYWLLIKIKHPEKHNEHFEALKQDFKSYGINIDEACKDVSRLRICSYDEEAYFNHYAKIYTKLPKKKAVRSFDPLRHTNERTVENSFKKLINIIASTGTDITTGYNNWLNIGFAIHSEFGEAGRDYFHAVSQYHSEYTHQHTDRKYDSICKSSSTGITISTFFSICKDHNITFN